MRNPYSFLSIARVLKTKVSVSRFCIRQSCVHTPYIRFNSVGILPFRHCKLFSISTLTFTLVSSISGHAVAGESIDAIFTCPVILTRITYFHTCLQYIRSRSRRWIHWRHLYMSRYSDTDYLLSHLSPVYPVAQSQVNPLTPSLDVPLFWHGLLTFTLVSGISGRRAVADKCIDAIFTCPVILTRITYFHTCLQYIRSRSRRWIHWRHL